MRSTTAELETARAFIRDLGEAEAIYRRLTELTRNQSEILRAGISPELLELVQAKEGELERLAQLEKTLGPARRSWIDFRERAPDGVRSEVQAVVGRVEGVLRTLLELEAEEGRCLAARRDETISQIRRLDSARKMRGAYGGGEPPPALLDQKE